MRTKTTNSNNTGTILHSRNPKKEPPVPQPPTKPKESKGGK